MTVELFTEPPTASPARAESGASSIIAWAHAASDAARLVTPLVQTDFVPAHFRGNVAAATAAVLYGAEAGLSPLQALQGVYVISGRPALYARAMLAITLSQGHQVWTEELTDARAVVCGQRKGTQHTERVVWTMDRAKKAGYTKNAKYGSDPQSMLLARAQSDVCRRVAPDALLGMSYSVEELEDEAAPPAPVTVMQREPVRRAQRKPVEPAPAAPEPDLEPDLEPPAATPTDESPDLITSAQSRMLHAALNEHGLGNRDDGLAYISSVIGRDVDTSKDLSKGEASRVIDQLTAEPVKDDPWDAS